MIPIRPLPFLLALMCLATTIAPAVADTPAKPGSKAAGQPTLYDRVMAGAPGALLDLHMQLLYQDYVAGENQFIGHRGRYTKTAAEAVDAGDFPFRPMRADGSVWPVVDLPAEQIVSPSTIGLRNRPTDRMLLMMGANGDPLAPCMRTRDLHYYPLGWPVEYPWRIRLATHLTAAVQRQLLTALALSGHLPATPAEMQLLVQMAPAGGSWHDMAPASAIAVQVEIDTQQQRLRLTAIPQPTSGQPVLLQLDPPGPTLVENPYLALQSVEWKPWGVLVWDTPLPHQLSTWSPPEPPPYEPVAWGYQFGSDGAGQLYRELALLGSWYQVNAGRMPTAEALLSSDWGLHIPLDGFGSPIPIIHYPLAEFLSQPHKPGGIVDHSALPVGLLVDVDSDSVMIKLQELARVGEIQHSFGVWRQQLAVIARGWGAPLAGGGQQLDGEAALAWDMWQRHPELGGSALQSKLWKDLLQTEARFESLYLNRYNDSLSDLLGSWLKRHGPISELPAWTVILDEMHVKPRRYTILAPGEVAPPGTSRIELGYAAVPGVIRCTVTYPSGVRLNNYKAVGSAGQIGPSEFSELSDKADPEVTVLDYQHVVTIALPIPKPPDVTVPTE